MDEGVWEGFVKVLDKKEFLVSTGLFLLIIITVHKSQE